MKAPTHHRSTDDTSSYKGSPSVLIVDDDDEIRHLLALLFETEDFEIVGEAADGANAVALAAREKPDFIVLDYLMPGMKGDETAQLLRAVAPDSRIIAFSAVLSEQPHWADAFLDKDRVTQIAPLLGVLAEQPRSSVSAPTR